MMGPTLATPKRKKDKWKIISTWRVEDSRWKIWFADWDDVSPSCAKYENMFSGATAISGGALRPIWLYTVECCRSGVCSTHFSWEDEDPLENQQPTEWPCLDTNSYPRYDGERDIIGMVLLIINPHWILTSLSQISDTWVTWVDYSWLDWINDWMFSIFINELWICICLSHLINK